MDIYPCSPKLSRYQIPCLPNRHLFLFPSLPISHFDAINNTPPSPFSFDPLHATGPSPPLSSIDLLKRKSRSSGRGVQNGSRKETGESEEDLPGDSRVRYSLSTVGLGRQNVCNKCRVSQKQGLPSKQEKGDKDVLPRSLQYTLGAVKTALTRVFLPFSFPCCLICCMPLPRWLP